MTRAQELACKISEILGGELVDDVGQALASLVAIYLAMALKQEHASIENMRLVVASRFLADVVRNMGAAEKGIRGFDIMPKDTLQ